MRLLITSAAGLRAQQLALDTVSDNMANVNTNGFKERQVDFAEALAQNQHPGQNVENKSSVSIGAGVVYRGTPFDLEQGQLVKSENPWDLAIDGKGYFPVRTANGTQAFTRDGSFKLVMTPNEQGEIAGQIFDKQGNKLQYQEEEAISEGDHGIIVGDNGKITGLSSDNQPKVFGQINLFKFNKPELLSAIGNNLLVPTKESGGATQFTPGTENVGVIKFQTIELSNVNLANSMGELLQAQRAYQANVRMIQNGDQMEAMANALRR